MGAKGLWTHPGEHRNCGGAPVQGSAGDRKRWGAVQCLLLLSSVLLPIYASPIQGMKPCPLPNQTPPSPGRPSHRCGGPLHMDGTTVPLIPTQLNTNGTYPGVRFSIFPAPGFFFVGARLLETLTAVKIIAHLYPESWAHPELEERCTQEHPPQPHPEHHLEKV